MEEHTTTTDTPTAARFRPLAAAPGLLLGPVAFAFGAFAALLLLPALLPWFKRLRPAAYAGFGAIALCWGLSAVGVNPWVDYGRARALARLEATLGGPVEYETFSGNAMAGTLSFTGVRAALPDGAGMLKARALEISVGHGLVMSGEPRVFVSGLQAELDPAEGKLEKWLRRERQGGELKLAIAGGRVALKGDETAAAFTFDVAEGEFGDSTRLTCGFKTADITLLGRTHHLSLQGGFLVAGRGADLRIETTLVFSNPELVHGMLVGTLIPGGPGKLQCTLDRLELKPLWETYRQLDVLSGNMRGVCDISGDLNDLRLDLRMHTRELRYFHRPVMNFDESQSFHLPEADLTGALIMRDGDSWTLDQLTLTSEDCTLSTNPRCQAWGGGHVTLTGPISDLKGELDITVARGRIAEPISWNALSRSGLDDLAPNLVMLGEQFPTLELDWKADIQRIDVGCEPLTGTVSGKLAGTFSKAPDSRSGSVRAGGRLTLADGKFRFLGAAGDVQATLDFSPTAPARYATLRGRLTGSAGETPLHAEITSRLDRPAFKFFGVTMKPEELGRKIYTHANEPLTSAEQTARREQCVRLCGVHAASGENPFLVVNTRDAKVFFSFTPEPPKGE
jgi:hypothetical protein